MGTQMTASFHYGDSQGVSHFIAMGDPNDILAEEIGPEFIHYRQLWEAAKNFKLSPPFPLHIDYEMKFKCNISCPMCLMSLPPPLRRPYGDETQELTFDTVAELITHGASCGQKSMGFGGLWEPLLSPHIPQLVTLGRKMGLVDAMFNTNGLRLNEKIGRQLIKAGLTRLMISLDATTPEVYDQMRPKSDFATVITNIKNFLKLRRTMNSRLPLLRLSFCRTAINEHQLDDFKKQWVGEVDFLSIQNYGRYDTISPPDFPKTQSGPKAEGLCAQPFKRLLVRHNGFVWPCCDASAALGLVVGNIYDKSLADIWHDAPLADLRKTLTQRGDGGPNTICHKCAAKFHQNP
ncbi:MAG: radical SAM protein [Candidatus Adiutrix sp.]